MQEIQTENNIIRISITEALKKTHAKLWSMEWTDTARRCEYIAQLKGLAIVNKLKYEDVHIRNGIHAFEELKMKLITIIESKLEKYAQEEIKMVKAASGAVELESESYDIPKV
jgi:hypothetical protein